MEKNQLFKKNESAYIPLGSKHKLSNRFETTLILQKFKMVHLYLNITFKNFRISEEDQEKSYLD